MLRKLLADPFYRANAVVFTTSIGTAALNFLLHPLLARLLSVEDYGEVQALLALASGLAIFLTIFGNAAMNITANTDGHDHADATERRRVITALRNVVVVIASLLLFATVAMSGWLSIFLRFDSPVPLIGLAFLFVTMIPLMFRHAFLRGSRRFLELGIAHIVQAGAKLLSVSAFVLAGWRSVGAVAGIVMGQLAAFAYAHARTRQDFGYVPGVGLAFDSNVRRELRFAALVLAVSVTNTFLATSDIILIKHYFDPVTAGAYAGIAVVGRIVLFAAGLTGVTLQPSVRLRAAPQDNQLMLRKSLTIILTLGGAALAAFLLLPEFIIRMVVGERFLDNQALLPWLGLLMLLTAIASSILAYYLSLRRRFAGIVGLSAVALILVLCANDHGSVEAIIRNYYVGVIAILGAVAVRWGWTYTRIVRPADGAAV